MSTPSQVRARWFGVRTFVAFNKVDDEPQLFEERVTLWWASSFADAVARAEAEAADYASVLDGRYLGLAQAYDIGENNLGNGVEVFSLIRDSRLAPDQYLTTFFDTGDEHQNSF